jgi:hypothetical protein
MPDGLAMLQSGNLYVYAVNNPLIYKDPTGNLAVSQYDTYAKYVGIGYAQKIAFGGVEALTTGYSTAKGAVEMAYGLATGQLTAGDIAAAVGDGIYGDVKFLIDNADQFSPDVELTDAQIKTLAAATLGSVEEVVTAVGAVAGGVKSVSAAAGARAEMGAKNIAAGTLPEGWTKTTNNGFTHIKDVDGVTRIRIDPPDAKTPYRHKHLYDEAKNPLDINGNIVDRKSPNAHIPIK